MEKRVDVIATVYHFDNADEFVRKVNEYIKFQSNVMHNNIIKMKTESIVLPNGQIKYQAWFKIWEAVKPLVSPEEEMLDDMTWV